MLYLRRRILSLVLYTMLFSLSSYCLTSAVSAADNTPHITIIKKVPANLHILLPNMLKEKIIDSEAIHAFRIYYRQNHVLIRGWVI